jgi:hypothetical protein
MVMKELVGLKEKSNKEQDGVWKKKKLKNVRTTSILGLKNN